MKIFKYIIISLILYSPALLYSQKQAYYKIPIQTNRFAQIFSIAQDENGAIVLGTERGIFYFDGNNFYRENSKFIKDSLIVSLFVYQNLIFSGNVSGFSVLNPNSNKNNYYKTGASVFSFSEWFDRIFVLTSNGIFVFKDNTLTSPPQYSFLKNHKVYQATLLHGKYYFATNKGLYEYDYPKNKYKRIFKNKVYGVVADKHGVIWLSTKKGVYKYFNNQVILFNKNFKSENILSVIVYNEKKDILVLNVKDNRGYNYNNFGYAIVIINKNRELKKLYDLPFPADSRLFFDKDDDLWMASNYPGLMKYLSFDIDFYDRHFGVKSNPFGFCKLSDGTILIATDGQGVLKFEKDHFVNFINNSPKTVWKIVEDYNKVIWLATSEGLFQYDRNKKKLKKINRIDPNFDFISEIYSEKNLLWIGTAEGLFSYGNGKIEKKKISNFEKNFVFEILPTFNGNYWICTNKGLFKFDGEKQIPFRFRENLNRNLFSSFVASPDGKLLLGTKKGIILFDENAKDSVSAIKKITEDDGLIFNNVFHLFFYKEMLWILTEKGLSILDYNKYIRTGIISFTNFGEGDFTLGREYNQFSSLIENNGTIWLGQVGGVLRIKNPNEIVFKKQIIKPYIKEIIVLGDNQNKRVFKVNRPGESIKKFSLQYNENNLVFVTGVISFSNNFLVKFNEPTYSNYNNAKITFWNEHGKIFALDISPGEYDFSIKATDQFSNSYNSENVVSFTIKLPFWKTWYFYGFNLLLFFVVLSGLFLYRERLHNKNSENLRKLLDEKDEIANKLRSVSKEYQELFENAFTPMIIVDYNSFLILDANNSACRLFDYTFNKIKNLQITEILEIKEENLKKLIENLQNTKTGYYDFNSKMRKSTGKTFDAQINIKVIKYQNRKAFILVINDVTKELMLQENLKQSKLEKEKAENIKDNFLAQISHEIRTPLNSILNNITFINEELKDVKLENNEDIELSIGSIVRSGRRIIRTMEAILNKSQLDSNAYKFKARKINIVDILNEVVDEYKEIAEIQEINIMTNYPQNHIWIIADEYSVLQIFINIIDNAVKYTTYGSVTINVNKRDDGKVAVIVKDTGIGISEEYLERIFDVFSQEDDSGYKRKYEGVGIGLSVVKKFCDLNNAEIKFDSEKGKGTTVTVIF